SSLARSETKCSASVRAAKYPPRPIAMAPAATSASPAVTMMPLDSTAPDRPAASAKGTVRPSDMPITMSRTAAEAVKCFSTCGVCGILLLPFLAGSFRCHPTGHIAVCLRGSLQVELPDLDGREWLGGDQLLDVPIKVAAIGQPHFEPVQAALPLLHPRLRAEAVFE